jgi:hypothetical protein
MKAILMVILFFYSTSKANDFVAVVSEASPLFVYKSSRIFYSEQCNKVRCQIVPVEISGPTADIQFEVSSLVTDLVFSIEQLSIEIEYRGMDEQLRKIQYNGAIENGNRLKYGRSYKTGMIPLSLPVSKDWKYAIKAFFRLRKLGSNNYFYVETNQVLTH